MVGFASDGTSVMMGCNNSVTKLLMLLFKDKIPHLFIDMYLSFIHIVCSYACKTMSESVELLVCQLYSYFKFSNKKITEYKEFSRVLRSRAS